MADCVARRHREKGQLSVERLTFFADERANHLLCPGLDLLANPEPFPDTTWDRVHPMLSWAVAAELRGKFDGHVLDPGQPLVPRRKRISRSPDDPRAGTDRIWKSPRAAHPIAV